MRNVKITMENGTYKINADDTETIEVKFNEFRTIVITPDEIKTIDICENEEPIIKKYSFLDMELINDVLAEINTPLYSQIKKLVAKNKQLKEKLEKTETPIIFKCDDVKITYGLE